MDLSIDSGHGAPPARKLEAVAKDDSSASPQAETMRLSVLWAELIAGTCKIESTTFSEQRCALVVTSERNPGPALAMPSRHADIIERSLVDCARKSVAIDLGLCSSSVAESLKHGFSFMGLSCWPSRIPLLLVMAAHAHRSRALDRSAVVVVADTEHFSRRTISVSRPDNELASRLTPAEYAVTRLLVEGRSHVEMARLRETSTRTVANQLAAAFHRLGVSGRAELLGLLSKRRAAVETSTRVARVARAAPTAVDLEPRFRRAASS
jgi:DNA-binding CsgD family transcriptional regulator